MYTKYIFFLDATAVYPIAKRSSRVQLFPTEIFFCNFLFICGEIVRDVMQITAGACTYYLGTTQTTYTAAQVVHMNLKL